MIKIGCCGFPVNRSTYYRNFKVVEVQKTFYQLPKIETAIKWKDEAPSGFEFTLKAWQIITHQATSPTYKRLKITMGNKENYGFFKPTKEVFSAWEKTEKICSALRAKIVIFQCPPSFKPNSENKENMRKFFTSIDRKNYTFVWEPRGKWEEKEIEKLCKELDLIHGVDPFKSRPLYGKLRYFRLHGKDGYRYKYSEEDFKQLLELIEKNIDTYIMFNNLYMFEDANKFVNFFKSVNF